MTAFRNFFDNFVSSFIIRSVEAMQPRVTCRENRYHVIRNGRGFIAGPIADVSGDEGGGLCVLVFNIPKGQRLNVTLLDFSPSRNQPQTGDFIPSEDQPSEDHQDPTATTRDYPHKSDHESRDHPPRDSLPGELLPSNNTTPVSVVLRIVCRQYAVIREPATGLSAQVCGGAGNQARERHVYLSRSNIVHLQLLTWPQVNAAAESQNFGQLHYQPIKYLLQYEGCSLVCLLFDK